MMPRLKPYTYQKPDWPKFTWQSAALISLFSEVRNLQGRLVGRMEALGFDLQNEALLDNLTLGVLKSSEIERILPKRQNDKYRLFAVYSISPCILKLKKST